MNQVPRLFRRFIPQLLHMIVLPVFFFAFMLIYRPFDVVDFLGSEWYGVHTTMISCIILACVVIIRLIYYYIPMRINYTIYAFWCLAEVIFMSFFAALYIWLILDRSIQYFDVLTFSFQVIFFILILPYTILALSLRIAEYHKKESDPEMNSVRRMRFYDERHNLKIVLTADAILYISAEINYVNIVYMENDKVRTYILRSSMKAIEELCQDNGLMRCHRSFYVNPSHIKVLRKDMEGVMYAELDADDVRHIPVTRKYYASLSEAL